MFDEFEVERVELLQHLNPDDLNGNLEHFDRAMEMFKENYERIKLPVKYYANVSEFEEDYL